MSGGTGMFLPQALCSNSAPICCGNETDSGGGSRPMLRERVRANHAAIKMLVVVNQDPEFFRLFRRVVEAEAYRALQSSYQVVVSPGDDGAYALIREALPDLVVLDLLPATRAVGSYWIGSRATRGRPRSRSWRARRPCWGCRHGRRSCATAAATCCSSRSASTSCWSGSANWPAERVGFGARPGRSTTRRQPRHHLGSTVGAFARRILTRRGRGRPDAGGLGSPSSLVGERRGARSRAGHRG